VDHPFIKPSSILSHEVLEAYAGEYLYLGCVQFVKQVKKGPLQETSPMLVDISGIPMWSKVNSGMVKMYQAEVLAKFPIMQHFLFGSLIQWAPERLAAPHGTSSAPAVPAALPTTAPAPRPAAAAAVAAEPAVQKEQPAEPQT
jgi:serine/threonine-protein phosphatase 2A activator